MYTSASCSVNLPVLTNPSSIYSNRYYNVSKYYSTSFYLQRVKSKKVIYSCQLVRKFCNNCRRELPPHSKYLLCKDCHLKILINEDEIQYYSRLYY
jgi:hypothetical protein